MNKPLKHHGLAEDICREELDRYQEAFSTYPLRCEASLKYGDLNAVLAGRFGVLEYLAAAHYLDNKPAFKASCDTLLLPIEALVKQFRWAPEILAVELSLALMTGDSALAQYLAQSIIDGPKSSNPHFDRFQAESLAAMVLDDETHALSVVTDLLEFLDNAKLSKYEREQGLHWSDALKHLSTKDIDLAHASIHQLKVLHGRHVDRELAKILRGAESAFSPFDGFDYQRLGLSAYLNANSTCLING